MSTGVFLQLAVSGVAVGSIYALVALGFVLIYKASGILNFAHGELLMLAAFMAYVLVKDFGINFWIALLLTVIFLAGLGALIHFGLLRSMIGQPHFSIVMVTIGLASMIRAAVASHFGFHEHHFPRVFSSEPIYIGSAQIAAVDVTLIVAVGILVAIFMVFFKFAPLGVRMMAAADYLEAAAISGVNIHSVFGWAWAIASLAAGVAGVFMANLQVFHVDTGAIALRAFPAAILGGLDSVGGAVLGGVIIGVLEVLAAYFFGSETRQVTAFIVLLLVLVFRPYGLFGRQDVERV